jgi:hypothetical protein
MTMTGKQTGSENCVANVERYFSNMTSAVSKGTLVGAELVRNWANDHITPIDTGFMVNTSFSHNVSLSVDVIGASIVYVAPYAGYVEVREEGVTHGYAYNLKHAAEIAMGKDHARKPEEQDHFLGTSVQVKKNEVFSLIRGAALNVTI